MNRTVPERALTVTLLAGAPVPIFEEIGPHHHGDDSDQGVDLPRQSGCDLHDEKQQVQSSRSSPQPSRRPSFGETVAHDSISRFDQSLICRPVSAGSIYVEAPAAASYSWSR